ncbi:Acyl-coenzyme A synthetase ACSM3, mitochondrial [Chionoecetes opilio]|uniref:medium-chain acyl-CoA ligase n=1 Tax=Chionoecetes opilio TaxID=41210 RepID=A0A8J5CV27_CHIOP|nr:Acyl-coenzyme A synthetase ACSM3, mitochondrial [Chionoecetes opilio]
MASSLLRRSGCLLRGPQHNGTDQKQSGLRHTGTRVKSAEHSSHPIQDLDATEVFLHGKPSCGLTVFLHGKPSCGLTAFLHGKPSCGLTAFLHGKPSCGLTAFLHGKPSCGLTAFLHGKPSCGLTAFLHGKPSCGLTVFLHGKPSCGPLTPSILHGKPSCGLTVFLHGKPSCGLTVFLHGKPSCGLTVFLHGKPSCGLTVFLHGKPSCGHSLSARQTLMWPHSLSAGKPSCGLTVFLHGKPSCGLHSLSARQTLMWPHSFLHGKPHVASQSFYTANPHVASQSFYTANPHVASQSFYTANPHVASQSFYTANPHVASVFLARQTLMWPHSYRWHSPVSRSFNYESLKSETEHQLQPKEFFNFAQDIVAPWASLKPSHPALYFTDGHRNTVISYSDLLSQAKALATALSESQAPKCALVLLPKLPAWWVVNVAASCCGTILSCGTTMLTPRDVAHRLSQCGADCVICTPELAASLDHVTQTVPLRIVVPVGQEDVHEGWLCYNKLLEAGRARPARPCVASRGDDIAQLFFTSGTTGKPKMVPHTQASYGIGHIGTMRYWLDLREDDMIWNISDTGWAKAAWSSLYTPLMAGATAFVHQMQRFDAKETLRALSEHPVTVLCAPPTVYRALVQCQLSQYPLPALHHCVSAGEPLNPEVMQAWTKNTGLQIHEGFGQSETTLLSGVCKGMALRPGSMGKPAPGYNLKVVNEQLQQLPPHHEGQLAVSLEHGHPIGLFKGYLGDDHRTSEAFRGGYYFTGDRAYYDEDGYFWFVGRADDVIISSGYRIGPFEVESCLLEHPAVAESAVVSSPDELRGEVVKAFVVLAEGYKHQGNNLISELQDHVKHTTAPYKYPRKIEFVDSLPKTVSGKIRRIELRNKEWGTSK